MAPFYREPWNGHAAEMLSRSDLDTSPYYCFIPLLSSWHSCIAWNIYSVIKLMDDCQSRLLLRRKIEEINKANVFILKNNSFIFRAFSKWRVPFSPFVQTLFPVFYWPSFSLSSTACFFITPFRLDSLLKARYFNSSNSLYLRCR